jgi:hypothetical protein
MSTNPLPAPTQEPSIADDILNAISCVDVNESADAAAVADKVIDRVIVALRRDQRIPKLGRIEFELLLGDARLDIERDIADVIEGTVNLDDVEQAVTEALSGEEEASS